MVYVFSFLHLGLDDTAGRFADFVLPNLAQRFAEFGAFMGCKELVHALVSAVCASKHVLPAFRAPLVYHRISQLETRRRPRLIQDTL